MHKEYWNQPGECLFGVGKAELTNTNLFSVLVIIRSILDVEDRVQLRFNTSMSMMLPGQSKFLFHDENDLYVQPRTLIRM